jgi:hypothetical protein
MEEEQRVTVHPLLIAMSMTGLGRLYVGGGLEVSRPRSVSRPNVEFSMSGGGAAQIQAGALWVGSQLRRGAVGMYAGGGVGGFVFPSSASTLFFDTRLGLEMPISGTGVRAEARIYLPTPMLSIGLGLRVR